MMPPHSFTVSLSVTLRLCTAEDLPNLEWFGMFSAHREIIRSTFEAQQRGDALMILAEANGFPIGQVWVDRVIIAKESAAFLWALRVMPGFQRLGIGSRLLDAAEEQLKELGFSFAEITTDVHNEDARRLYESRGYIQTGTRFDEWDYTTPEGEFVHASATRIVHRKSLKT